MNNTSIEVYLSSLHQIFFGIESVYLFGSYINSNSPNDIDIIIVFENQSYVHQSRLIKRDFFNRFHKTLDIQLFTNSQIEQINSFLNRTGHWIEKYVKGPPS